jgi:adenine phosphoribosyltransferase
VRKKGKLPWKTYGTSYDLEYGSATIEVHQDAVLPGETVLLADDLLATGGTAAAALELIAKLGGEVLATVFFIELAFLDGREKLAGKGPVHALLTY